MQMISNSYYSYLQNIFQIYLYSPSPTATILVQEASCLIQTLTMTLLMVSLLLLALFYFILYSVDQIKFWGKKQEHVTSLLKPFNDLAVPLK